MIPRNQWLFVPRIAYAVVLLGSAISGAELPAVTARLDTHVVTLGDRITVRLELHHSEAQEPVRPDVGTWLHGLEAEVSETRHSGHAAGEHVWRFDAQVQLFEMGEHHLAELPVSFITATGDTVMRTTPNLSVKVLGVRADGDLEPRDIKPPVPVPLGFVPLWWLLGGLVLLGSGAVLLYRKARHRHSADAAEANVDPVDYVAEFVRIAGMGLLERGAYKAYYSLLADNLRAFLEHWLDVDAMELTTHEIVTQLHTGKLHSQSELIDAVQHFLATADLVKFARIQPEMRAARRAPEVGIALLQRIQAEMELFCPVDTVDAIQGRTRAVSRVRQETKAGGW